MKMRNMGKLQVVCVAALLVLAVQASGACSFAALAGASTDAMRGPALKDGAPDVVAKVCDFQSAADADLGSNYPWFSVWF